MAKDDELTPEFENLNFPSEGMPDPTAHSDASDEQATSDAPKGKKSRRKKKKPPREKKARERKPKTKSGGGLKAIFTPYTVLLAIAFIAILIAVFCLAMQIAEYGGDYKATKAKSNISMSAPSTIHSIDLPPIHRV